jgi:hypothetical protein
MEMSREKKGENGRGEVVVMGRIAGGVGEKI